MWQLMLIPYSIKLLNTLKMKKSLSSLHRHVYIYTLCELTISIDLECKVKMNHSEVCFFA